MRQILKVTITALLVLVQSNALLAKPSWVRIATSVGGDQYSIEKESLRHQNNIAWFWVKVQPLVPDENGFTYKMYHSANCKTQQHRIRTIIDFDIEGKVTNITEDEDQAELIQASPDSVDYALLQ